MTHFPAIPVRGARSGLLDRETVGSAARERTRAARSQAFKARCRIGLSTNSAKPATMKFMIVAIDEHRMPVAAVVLQHAGERHDPSRRAFRRVEQPGIGRGVFRAVGVGTGRREQTEDFAPGKEHEPCHEDEHVGRMSQLAEAPIGEPSEREHDRHRVLAADEVGDPAEERPRQTVEDVVDHQRRAQHGRGYEQDVHFLVCEAEVLGDRRDLRGRHEARRRHHDEHDVEQPEDRRLQHFNRGVIPQRLHQPRCRLRRFTLLRGAQQLRENEDDQPLPKAEPQKGGLIAVGEDDVADGNDGRGSAGAEASGGEARGESAAIRKPLERVADAGAVNRAGADARDGRRDVEHRQCACDRIDRPGDGHKYAAESDDEPRTEAIDEPAFDRHQPGFGGDEDAEGNLNCGGAPMVFLIDRIDEERPAILQVGDHHHADDAADELAPSFRRCCQRAGFKRRRGSRHCFRP